MNPESKKSLQEIERDYRTSIEVPEQPREQQIFFCPVGLVGAGKTTVTKPVAERLGLVRVSSDEIREQLKLNGHDYSTVKEIGMRIVQDFAVAGHSIAFDMDCGNPEVKNFAEQLAAMHPGSRVYFAHIEAPEAFIFEKFRRHAPSWLADNPQTMIDNYFAQKARRAVENTQFDFSFTFDTSRPDLAEQISEFCSQIEQEELNSSRE